MARIGNFSIEIFGARLLTFSSEQYGRYEHITQYAPDGEPLSV